MPRNLSDLFDFRIPGNRGFGGWIGDGGKFNGSEELVSVAQDIKNMFYKNVYEKVNIRQEIR